MPSLPLDSLLTGVGVRYAFQSVRDSDHKKKLRIVYLFLGLLVFTIIPYFFDNVKDTGDKVVDVAAEGVWDTFRMILRLYISAVVFPIGSLLVLLG